MPAPEQPISGQVYFATGDGPVPAGTPGLFVRTEKRPGAEGPEHLVVVPVPGLRMTSERWEDPAEFTTRWAVDYTPPADPMEGHALRREHYAFRETFRDAADIIAGAIGTKDAGALAERAMLALRQRFVEHRAAAR